VFKVPARCPGSVEIDLGTDEKPEIHVLDAYDAVNLFVHMEKEYIDLCKVDSKPPLLWELQRNWASALFSMPATSWCPNSAGAVLEYVVNHVAELKKNGSGLKPADSPKSTASTVSRKKRPKPTDSIGSENPST